MIVNEIHNSKKEYFDKLETILNNLDGNSKCFGKLQTNSQIKHRKSQHVK